MLGTGATIQTDRRSIAADDFFRGMFDEVAARHPDVAADHAYVDATALAMVRRPWVLDVLVTEGDLDLLQQLSTPGTSLPGVRPQTGQPTPTPATSGGGRSILVGVGAALATLTLVG